VASLSIRWPNGQVESISKVASDQLIVVKEGSGIVSKTNFNRTPSR